MQLRAVWCLRLIGDTEGPTLIAGATWLRGFPPLRLLGTPTTSLTRRESGKVRPRLGVRFSFSLTTLRLIASRVEFTHQQFGDNHGVGHCLTPQRKPTHNPTHSTNPSPAKHPKPFYTITAVGFVGCNWSFFPGVYPPLATTPSLRVGLGKIPVR